MAAATKILITGATDGIGKHTATLLAQKGYHLLLHGRNKERLDACVRDIQRITLDAPICSYCADFESLSQVRDMVARITSEHTEIHVLINNAGVYSPAQRVTQDGMEATWQVNVVAQFLLTNMLLHTLRDRVVNVASISAASWLDFDNLNQEKGYSAHGACSTSKTAMQMFTYALARRLRNQGSSLTANCLDPGTVNTKVLLAGWGPCGIDVSNAGDEYYLATAPELAGVSGTYFVHQKPRTSSPASLDECMQERLWAVLEQQAGVQWP